MPPKSKKTIKEDEINTIISKYMKDFTQKVSEKYNIPFEELSSLSEEKEEKEEGETKQDKKEIKEDVEIDSTKLATMSKIELTVLCKKKGLPVKGNKNEIVQRIIDSLEKSDTNDSKDSKDNGDTVKKSRTKKEGKEGKEEKKDDKQSKTKKKKGGDEDKPVIKNVIQKNKPMIGISKNKFGNFEHSETSFVFDKNDKVVIGKQNKDGSVQSLTEKDILTCKEYDFKYVIPNDLNDEESKTKFSNTLKQELEENKEEKEDKEDDDAFISKLENKKEDGDDEEECYEEDELEEEMEDE